MAEVFETEEFTTIEFDQIKAASQRPVPEKHLDSPITTGLIDRLYSYLPRLQNGTRHPPTAADASKFLSRNPLESYGGIRSPLLELVSWMAKEKRTVDHCPQPVDTNDYPDYFNTGTADKLDILKDIEFSHSLFEKILETYRSEISPVLKKNQVDGIIQRLRLQTDLHPQLLITSSYAKHWESIVEDYRRTASRRWNGLVTRTFNRGPCSYVCCSGYLIIRLDKDHEWVLMTYEQLQMIQDVLLARENVYVALTVGLHNGDSDLNNLVPDLLSWQESCIRHYGNAGYELVKAPEAMYKAWINTLTKGDILPNTSFHRTVKKIKDKEKKLGDKDLVERLVWICRRTKTIGNCMELFGLIKVSGHPTVYANKSAQAVRAEAQPYMRTSLVSIMNMTRCFKHIILSNYIEKEASWPKFKLPPERGTLLHRHWLNRTTVLPPGAYDLSDLDHIRFDKFIEFDYSEDFLKFLDDKAISAGAEEVSAFWFGDRKKPRRLLIDALTKDLDMREIVERLRKREFRLDEMVIELTQKERELKPAARCFCKLPRDVRCFFTLLEYNLGKTIMSKYIPQQTMTMSTSETKNRLYNISKQGVASATSGFLEIDFSRWNLRWRSRTVNPIAYCLEDIYGMPGVFSQGHWFFENATVVLTDLHTLPAGVQPGMSAHLFPDSDLVWRNHLGGFEGILQKLWSICTIAMVYMSLLGLPTSFLMAGQGDNQILAITSTDSTMTRAQLFIKILVKLDLYCQTLGHDVKPEECIDSSTVISYSKEFYVEGVHRMYSLKFLSRTLRREDSDVPSLSADVSGTCSAAMMVADTLGAPLQAHWWQTYRLIRIFRERALSAGNTATERSLLAKVLHSPDLLEFFLTYPGSLGGLPIMAHTRYRIKGEVDDLIWDICAVLQLQSIIPSCGRALKMLMDGKLSPKTPDLEQLIVDPRSIPIDRPTDQRRLIKAAVRDQLPDLVTNKWLKEIINKRVLDVGDRLTRILTSMRPLYPQIAQDLFSSSLAGLAERVTNRFTMTRTIRNVTGSLSFKAEIQSSNSRLLRFLINLHQSTDHHRPGGKLPPPYEIARRLRLLWKLGDLQSCIGVYCPLEFELTEEMGTAISGTCRAPVDEHLRTIGIYPPNFGTRTKQKRSEHGFKIQDSSDTIKDIRCLVMIASELQATGALRELISDLISTRCPWGLATMEQYFPTSIGGSAAHRHENLQSGFFGTLGSNTVPTHLNFDTDNAGILSGGEDDYPIVFQEFFLLLESHFSVFSFSQMITSCLTLRYKIPPSLDPIPTDTTSVIYKPTDLKWSQVSPQNPLGYVETVFFSQFAQVPSATLLPYRLSPTKVDIVYSTIYWNLKYRGNALTSLRGAIIHINDLFDIKEAKRLTPHEIYRGTAAAVLVHALSAAHSSFLLKSSGVLQDACERLATAIAPSITKTLIHPSRREERGVSDNGILLQPGGGIPLASIGQTVGVITEYCNQLLATEHFDQMLPNLIVGRDNLGALAEAGRRIALSMIIKGLLPRTISSCPAVANRLNAAVFIGKINNSELLAFERVEEEYHRILRDYKRAFPSRAPYVIENSRLPIYQYPGDLAELIRQLRILAPTANSIELTSVPKLTLSLTPATGEIKVNQTRGQLSVATYNQCACPDDTPEERARETRRGYTWRSSGQIASVSSVWDYFFAHRPPRATRRALLIGVGRGAAAVSYMMACPGGNVVGIDLRSSFPLLTQRELSYIPPCVIQAGTSSRFEWAAEVFGSSGGDVFSLNLDQIIAQYDIDTVLVDIELDHWRITRYLSSLVLPNLYFRTRLCHHKFSSLFLSLDPLNRRGWDITLGSVTERQYLVYGNTTGIDAINVPSEELVVRPFHPKVVRSRISALSRLNDIIRPHGHQIKQYNPIELRRVADLIRQRWTNSSDNDIRTRGDQVESLLRFIAQCGKDDPLSTVKRLVSDLSIPREYSRQALLYLANMVPDCVGLVLI